jgi:hypothetical protein
MVPPLLACVMATLQYSACSSQKHKNLLHRAAPPRGDAWRMPARKEAGKQSAQNPEVLNPAFHGSD